MSARMQSQVRAAPAQPASAASTGLLQRKCACGAAAGLTGECLECSKDRLTTRRESTSQAESSKVPPIVHEVLRSPDQPLDPVTRAPVVQRFAHDFGGTKVFTGSSCADDRLVPTGRHASDLRTTPAFDHDFTSSRRVIPLPLRLDVREGHRTSPLDEIMANLGPGEPLSSSERQPLQCLSPVALDGVRVHSNPESQITADLLNSQAFTVGKHIVLGNAVNTAPARRKWLLAHEVAHAVQQHPRIATTRTESRDVAHEPEQEADQFADAVVAGTFGASSAYPTLNPARVGLARKVIWKYMQDLPNDLLLILDVDDGDFVGGCVRAIVPHVGVKLIKKTPHAQLFNLHVGFLTNPAGEYCIFFYESVTGICEMKCFPSKEALREAWDEVVEWIKEMLKKVIEALAIAALIVAIVVLVYLIAQAIAGALLVLVAAAA